MQRGRPQRCLGSQAQEIELRDAEGRKELKDKEQCKSSRGQGSGDVEARHSCRQVLYLKMDEDVCK